MVILITRFNNIEQKFPARGRVFLVGGKLFVAMDGSWLYTTLLALQVSLERTKN